MRVLYSVLLLPALSQAFTAPHSPIRVHSPLYMASDNQVADLASDVTQFSEDCLERVDRNVLQRAVRMLNHVPVVYTLRQLGNAVSSSQFGIDAAPSAFAGAVSSPSLLNLPQYVHYAWPVVAVAQLAQVSVSALAGDDAEMSQSDITVLSAANLCAARAVAATQPLPWLAAAGVLAAFPLRQDARNYGNKTNLRTAAFALLSSFASVSCLLSLAAKGAAALPDVAFKGEIVASAALFLYYGLVNREDNGLLRRLVNFGTIAAITAQRVMNVGGFNKNLASLSLWGAGAVTLVALRKVLDKLE